MTSSIPDNNEPLAIRLDSSLLEPRATEIVQELRTLLEGHARVSCDLSLVDAIDLLGVQLLLSARATQLEKAGTLSFESPSEPIRELCAVLGVDLENS